MCKRMAKADTIQALIESATTVFSESGYEGASLRDVAAGAGVPLSTINMYFGAKSDLYVAVMAQLWRDIEMERAALLADRVAAKGGGAPDLRDLVSALVTPVVMRARSDANFDRRQPRLLRQWVSAPLAVRAELRKRNNSAAMLRRWIERFREACPSLSASESVWGFSFMVGALYSWELMDHRYEEIIDLEASTPEDIIAQLEAFCVSGFEGMMALAERRAVTPAPVLPPRLR